MPSTNEGLLLAIGAIFLLIGLVGGGLEVSTIKIPSVGKYPRIFSVGLGTIFVVIAIVRLFSSGTPSLATQPTDTPIPLTPIPTAIPTPSPTAIPPTATPEAPTASPSAGRYIQIPLNSVANDDLKSYGEPPTGNVMLGGVPFYISGSFGTQWDLLRDRPTSATLRMDSPISLPAKVFILINSGATYEQFKNLEIGTITLRFKNGGLHTTRLIVGQNIREWQFTAAGVVGTISNVDVQEVFRVKKQTETLQC